MADTEVTFVVAFPGWEVLYYIKGGRYETAPVVSWAIYVEDDTFVRAAPVSADLSWSIADERTLITPEGDVYCGELERWQTVSEWLAEMIRRENEEPDKLPTPRPLPQAQESSGNAPVVLDNYRRKFQRDGD